MKKNSRYVYFPILIDLRRFPCLVVGGGMVALRKVITLLEFNARVTVVSPTVTGRLEALCAQGKIKVIREPYSKRFIKGNKLVFSATDDRETNLLVSTDCRREGVLLNVADGPSWCDFILPATVKRGDMILSVSSQGKAPFFAKDMKNRIEEIVPPSVAGVAHLAGEFRRRLLSNGNSKSRTAKENAYKKFLSTNWERILAKEGMRKSYHHLDKILDETEKTKDR